MYVKCCTHYTSEMWQLWLSMSMTISILYYTIYDYTMSMTMSNADSVCMCSSFNVTAGACVLNAYVILKCVFM